MYAAKDSNLPLADQESAALPHELAARGGEEEGRTPTGIRPNGFRDRGRRRLSAGLSTVGPAGPQTGAQPRCATSRWCTPSESRTRGLPVRSRALYPLSYGGMVSPDRIERPYRTRTGHLPRARRALHRTSYEPHTAGAYPEQDSNLQHTGSEPVASPIGLPGRGGQPRYRTEQAPRARVGTPTRDARWWPRRTRTRCASRRPHPAAPRSPRRRPLQRRASFRWS
jgi:hypothetical protein